MKTLFTSRKLALASMELAVFLLFAVYAMGTYSQVDITYTVDDMELQDINQHFSGGGVIWIPLTKIRRLLSHRVSN